ncbi:MAG: hypothetical protein JW874_10690 [Spirochaetales bacterium]|nr:hypothetical protein [Spirochaetales bacterium]
MSRDIENIQKDIEELNRNTSIDDSQEVRLIKELISTLQGAPYPTALNKELYSIWYEHSLIAINNAYSFLNKSGKEPEEETVIP